MIKVHGTLAQSQCYYEIWLLTKLRKNLECGKQIETDVHEQNWVENIPVTVCTLHNSRQHFHENMIFKRGDWEDEWSPVPVPTLQHGSLCFVLHALSDTRITDFWE